MKWRVELLLIKRLIKYDIRAGFAGNFRKFLMLIVTTIIIGCIAADSIENTAETLGIRATILDYVCFYVGGPKHIPSDMFELYRIPVLWLLLQVMTGYMVGYYATNDLETYGQQVLIRSDSRAKWWISKCVWNGITVVAIYMVIFFMAIMSGIVAGADMEMNLTEGIVTSVCNVDALMGDNGSYIFILFGMTVFVSLTVSMLQMFISLVFSPVIGFIITQSIVFLSTLFENKLLFANYGMLTHNRITCDSNIEWAEGMILCMVIYAISFFGGVMYFSKCNILARNNE